MAGDSWKVSSLVKHNNIQSVHPSQIIAKHILIGWYMSHQLLHTIIPKGKVVQEQRPEQAQDRECQVKEFRSYLLNIR